jgi:hypothetical protein
LANCKPGIRLTKKVGDYIAGFTSERLCKDVPGNEKLVYIMRVTEKITISEYWTDPRFRCKRPLEDNPKSQRGDNIYIPSPVARHGFTQLTNVNHCARDIKKDIGGTYVLVSNDFYYFGRAPIDVKCFNINLANGQSPYGSRTDKYDDLISFLNTNYGQHKNTIIAHPHGKQI